MGAAGDEAGRPNGVRGERLGDDGGWRRAAVLLFPDVAEVTRLRREGVRVLVNIADSLYLGGALNERMLAILSLAPTSLVTLSVTAVLPVTAREAREAEAAAREVLGELQEALPAADGLITHGQALAPEAARHLPDRAPRVRVVLQHLRADDDVEAAIGERQCGRVRYHVDAGARLHSYPDEFYRFTTSSFRLLLGEVAGLEVLDVLDDPDETRPGVFGLERRSSRLDPTER